MAEVVLFELQAEIGNLTKELNQIKAQLGMIDTEATDAADAFDKMGKEGADAADKVTKATKKTEKQVEQTSKEVRGLSNQFKHFQQQATNATNKFIESQGGVKGILGQVGTAMGLAYGIDAVVNFGKASVDAFLEAEQNAQLLLNALNGNSAVQQRLIEQSGELQKKTIYSDDSIQAAQTYLATQGRTEEQIKKIIIAATNLSAVTGDDLQSAVLKLDGTYEGVIGRLGKLDNGFKQLSQEQLAAGAAIDLVNQKYAGFAEAAATTNAGKIKVLQNQIGDLMEFIGGYIFTMSQPFVDATTNAANGTLTFENAMKSLSTTVLQNSPTLGLLAFTISDTDEVIRDMYDSTLALNTAFEALTRGGEAANRVYEEAAKRFGATRQQVDEFYNSEKKLREEQANAPKTLGDLQAELAKYQAQLKDMVPGHDDYIQKQKQIDELNKKLSKSTPVVKTEMQLLNEQLSALKTSIENTIARGGVVSEADILKANRLTNAIAKINSERDKLLGTGSTTAITMPEQIGATPIELTAEEIAKPEVDAQKLITDALSERYLQEEALRQANLDAEKLSIQQKIDMYSRIISDILSFASQITGLIQQTQQQQFDEDLRRLKAEKDAKLSNTKLTAKEREQIEKQYAEKERQLQRENWEKAKQVQIANAIIQTAQAVLAAYSSGLAVPFAGPAVGAAYAAVAAAIGAAQIGIIAAQQNPYFEGTAFVERGSNPRGRDTIPARLNEGEAVIPTDANLKYPGMAQAWIDGRLDDYIMKQFVAPKLSEMEKAYRAESMNAMFDDYRLYRTMSEGNSIARAGFDKLANSLHKNKRSAL